MNRAITFFWIILLSGTVLATVFNTDHYTSISRTSLNCVNLVSLYPQGWLTKALKSPGLQLQGSRIKEIFYIPSIFHIRECEEYSSSIDDEHFCSKLCENGFAVHILDPVRKSDAVYQIYTQTDLSYLVYAIKESIDWRCRTHGLPGRCIAIIASELSAGALLNYLSEVQQVTMNILHTKKVQFPLHSRWHCL